MFFGDRSGVLSELFTVFGDEAGVAALSPAVALLATGLAKGLETGEVGIEGDGRFFFILGDAGMGEDGISASLGDVIAAFGTGEVACGAMVAEGAGGGEGRGAAVSDGLIGDLSGAVSGAAVTIGDLG